MFVSTTVNIEILRGKMLLSLRILLLFQDQILSQ